MLCYCTFPCLPWRSRSVFLDMQPFIPFILIVRTWPRISLLQQNFRGNSFRIFHEIPTGIHWKFRHNFPENFHIISLEMHTKFPWKSLRGLGGHNMLSTVHCATEQPELHRGHHRLRSWTNVMARTPPIHQSPPTPTRLLHIVQLYRRRRRRQRRTNQLLLWVHGFVSIKPT